MTIKLWQVTYWTGRIARGIVADTEQDARRAANWLHPSEGIKEVLQCH
jgi:hypothetical protein